MKPLIIALILGHSADATTSLVAFQKGLREVNPLVISTKPAPFIAEISAVAVGESWWLTHLSKKHPRVAKGLALAQIGGSALVSIHNAKLTHDWTHNPSSPIP